MMRLAIDHLLLTRKPIWRSPTAVPYGRFLESVLLALHRLDDPRPRAAEQGRRRLPRCLHVAPQRDEKGLRLACTVEVEIDHDVVGIVDESEDPVAAHARLLPADRIAVEGRFPRVEVADLVFDPQDVHPTSSTRDEVGYSGTVRILFQRRQTPRSEAHSCSSAAPLWVEMGSLLGANPPEAPLARLEIMAEGLTQQILEYEPELRAQLRLALEGEPAGGESLPLRGGDGSDGLRTPSLPCTDECRRASCGG